MAADCTISKSNLGLSKCNKLPALIKGMITAPQGFSLTPSASLLKASWQNALLNTKALRIYLWPPFKAFKDNSEKTVYEETELATMKVRDGRYRFNIDIKESLCLHKAMFTHSENATSKVFFIDTENQIIGTLDATGNFTGFDVELLNVEKLMFSDGKVSTKSPVYVVLSDNKQIDLNGYIINASSFVTSLVRLTDVDVAESGNLAGTSLKLTVKASCDGTSIDGLVAADFVVTSALGVARVITAVAQDPVTGIYTLTVTGLTVGDIANLAAPSVLSIPGYESTGSIVAA